MSVSGLSPDTYLLTVSTISDGFSVVIGLVAPKSPFTDGRPKNLYFRSVFYFRFKSSFRSDFYFWDSGGTTTNSHL